MDKKKNKKLNLKIWIPVTAVLLLIIVSAVFLLGSSTTVAALNIESGNVQVDTGRGWTTASDGMELSLNDKVKTQDGKAELVLYESILVEMDPNTEITISELSKDNTKLKQASGSTWNKFAAITGVKSFQIETPNTVATVRGTDFWVDTDSVGVGEGTVDILSHNKKVRLNSGKKVNVTTDTLNVEDFDSKDLARIAKNKEKIIARLEKLRTKEIQKHGAIYSMIKRVNGWTDEDVGNYMTRLDNGEFDENELKNQAGVPAKSLDKFAKISSAIKQQKADLQKIKDKLALDDTPVNDTIEPKIIPKRTIRQVNTK